MNEKKKNSKMKIDEMNPEITMMATFKKPKLSTNLHTLAARSGDTSAITQRMSNGGSPDPLESPMRDVEEDITINSLKINIDSFPAFDAKRQHYQNEPHTATFDYKLLKGEEDNNKYTPTAGSPTNKKKLKLKNKKPINDDISHLSSPSPNHETEIDDHKSSPINLGFPKIPNLTTNQFPPG